MLFLLNSALKIFVSCVESTFKEILPRLFPFQRIHLTKFTYNFNHSWKLIRRKRAILAIKSWNWLIERQDYKHFSLQFVFFPERTCESVLNINKITPETFKFRGILNVNTIQILEWHSISQKTRYSHLNIFLYPIYGSLNNFFNSRYFMQDITVGKTLRILS